MTRITPFLRSALNALSGTAATDAERDPAATRPLRKRIAVLLAAIAVPAMAAPGDWGALAGDARASGDAASIRLARQLADNPAMPFEQPGMSFPGSAFFFLADPPDEALIALPSVDAFDPGAEAGLRPGQVIDAGPPARAFFAASGIAHERALECLAEAVWYEAASESEAGQRAVAQVVLNRVAHPSWPASVCGVVYQGAHRATGCQFTFTCDNSLARRASGASWGRARRIAAEALSGSVYAQVGHATHYHTLWVNPYWAASLAEIGTIGAHRFYRPRGPAGEPSAFNARYSGVEQRQLSLPPATLPGARPADRGGDTLSRDPAMRAAPQPDTEPPAASGAPAPYVAQEALADPALSGVGQVREDYRRAGQWRSPAAREALEREQRALARGNTAAARRNAGDEGDSSPR
ncbi:cell wall hydrolase [Qipengyuania nanhaisediminis]|uniref:cell wall hydrolase n=1 Tax=Qipengyuania nanhaisediminis TaxID=604088 RepID=UPI0038B27F34